MPEEKASNFYPNTEFDQTKEESKGWFPKTHFDEQVEIPRYEKAREKDFPPVTMTRKEYPVFLVRELETGLSVGDYSERLSHYIGVSTGGEHMTKTSLKHLRALGEEFDGATTYNEQREVSEKISNFLRSLKEESV